MENLIQLDIKNYVLLNITRGLFQVKFLPFHNIDCMNIPELGKFRYVIDNSWYSISVFESCSSIYI